MSVKERIKRLRDAKPCILPSMLLCDFSNLEREIRRLEEAGIAGLHLDVMDGQFVPNFTYGLPIVEAVRKLTDLPLDVHLMMNEPQEYIQRFFDAGSDIMTIHVEAVREPREVLQQIRDIGAGSGLGLNPDTPLSMVEPSLDLCDLVLVMSVPAGFGGQAFREESLGRIEFLRAKGHSDLLIEVDGGVNASTISRCTEAGADLLVVGSAIFLQDSYEDAVRHLGSLVHPT